jgi:hypothetical protein
MIKILHDSAGCGFEHLEIHEHADVIKLLAANVDFYLPVVSVKVLTFASVASQRVRRREFFFDHYFVH